MVPKTYIILILFVGIETSVCSDLLCINRGGTCEDDSIACPGGYVSNHCSGASTRRCCLPSISSSITVDAACTSLRGHCQDDSLTCNGAYVSGKCSGASNRRCCIPVVDSGNCANVKIISRASWGARAPKHIDHEHLPVSLFFIHHTEGASCTETSHCIKIMQGIQNFHMDDRVISNRSVWEWWRQPENGWSDIGYSFLVGEDGNIYEGRGWDRIGAHTYGYNSRGLAASFMGSFMTHLPNDKALNAVKALIQCGVEKGYISHSYHLYGHRDVGSTDCPGTALYNLIRTWPHYSTVKP